VCLFVLNSLIIHLVSNIYTAFSFVRLVEVMTDTHAAVQKATKDALSHVGSVIRNPEIQIHVNKILRALSDPETTREALEALLNTNFVHSIDAPSLSLIMPVSFFFPLCSLTSPFQSLNNPCCWTVVFATEPQIPRRKRHRLWEICAHSLTPWSLFRIYATIINNIVFSWG
jgi:hypothetical protein